VEFDKAVAELETLVQTLEREGDERALTLLELVDAVHRPALRALAEGRRDDPLARALLAMYDLVEVDDELLVEEALDAIRPYIHSHGGEIELLEVSDGTVHVRMSGSCHGCAASAMTLKRGIEEALRERYPRFKEVVAHEPEGAAPEPQLLQIENARRPQFVDVEAGGLGPGELRAVEAEGVALLLVNVGGEIYAFRNACPVDDMPLEGGRLNDSVLVCPWHNCAYDARTGRRVDEGGGDDLVVVPIAVRDGALSVAVNVL
jgi:Fe-S cluster biogenesis protein NfuA/nitrite reductase/ring-hydroxylating ferredoxin subunit